MQEPRSSAGPLVSVCMITYNQAAFIADAIEGVLRQKVPFPIELVIGEDCSTDETHAICSRYARDNPDVIRLLPSEKNLGMNRNAIRTLAACSGQYVALCEGDDIWIDPEKLHLQYEALSRDEEAVGVFHDCWTMDTVTGRTTLGIAARAIDRRPGLRSLIWEKSFRTATMFFRNIGDWLESPPWFQEAQKMDYALALLLALRGPWTYVDRPMSVYRQHPGSVWSSRPWTDRLVANEQFFRILLADPAFGTVRDAVRGRLALIGIGVALADARDGHLATATRTFTRSWLVRGLPKRLRLLVPFLRALGRGSRQSLRRVLWTRSLGEPEMQDSADVWPQPARSRLRLAPFRVAREKIGRKLYALIHQAVVNALREESQDIKQALQRQALEQTAEFVRRSIPTQRFCSDRHSLFDEALSMASHHGLHLEFGVYLGRTIDYLASRRPHVVFYGFDSFEGLKEPWLYSKPGKFDLKGAPPQVRSNVRLVKGWFDSSLPAFLSKHDEKCSFVHIDSDVYSSAKTVLDLLTPRLVPGTVLVFDEFFNYPGWQNGEYRAFTEWVQEHHVFYEFIGCTTQHMSEGSSTGQQAAIRITGFE